MYNNIMNQILQTPRKSASYGKSKKKKGKVFFRTFSILSGILAICFTGYYLYRSVGLNRNEEISHILIGSYDVSRLYAIPSTSSNSNNSRTNTINNNSNENTSESTNNNELVNLEINGEEFSVIGILQINSIDLKYPIISEISDYLLEIAPCKFHGPFPGEVRQPLYCRTQL